ncbi:ATP-dependent DNA helicase pif1 [Eumeta japonica]|uniref:ATP-dependent DNA helicase n=1 Tax=Eumeta variegata TaxID=151549 RepID=A0A4C1WWW9_EUMVA|nr:ATP-dependent DNA helicase pif1 [Eumeta japonica]
MDYYKKQQGSIIFLSAPGGTGKTFWINLFLAEIRANKEIVFALASSGIAPTVMDGGRTAHSGLKLPLNVADYEFPVCDITQSSARAQILKQCKAIIWDESTIAYIKSLEALKRTLQDVRYNTNVTEDVLLMLSDDFRQTLPVIRKLTSADDINTCL